MRCKQMLSLSVVTVLLAASLAGCGASSTAPSAVSSEAPSSAASSAASEVTETAALPGCQGEAEEGREEGQLRELPGGGVFRQQGPEDTAGEGVVEQERHRSQPQRQGEAQGEAGKGFFHGHHLTASLCREGAGQNRRGALRGDAPGFGGP